MSNTDIVEMVPHTQVIFDSYEQMGLFNTDINPAPWETAIPVTKDFPYMPSPKVEQQYAKQRLTNTETVKGWLKANNIKVELKGAENISKTNGAIAVGNHYCIFDWYFIGKAIKETTGKDTYSIIAEFNNRNDWAGDLLRSERCLPLCNKGHFGQTDTEKQIIKENLNNTISTRLKNGDNILVMPSGTMWRMYKKPQPAHSGAFHWAIDNNKPILPVFATNKPNGEHNEQEPERNKNIKLHFGEPIHHNPNLYRSDNVANMIKSVFLWQKNIYEREYNTELNYNCAPEINKLVKSGVSATEIKKALCQTTLEIKLKNAL